MFHVQASAEPFGHREANALGVHSRVEQSLGSIHAAITAEDHERRRLQGDCGGDDPADTSDDDGRVSHARH